MGFSLSLSLFPPKYLNENKITSSCFIFHHKTIDTNNKLLISNIHLIIPYGSMDTLGFTFLSLNLEI